jgi:hypothetical protein
MAPRRCSGYGYWPGCRNARLPALTPFFTTKDRARDGLGLSISYGIVQSHGGRLNMRLLLVAEPNSPSHFPTCLLGRGAVGSARGSRRPASGKAGRSILVVDADCSHRTAVALFGLAGHRVVSVLTGDEGCRSRRKGV